MKYMTLSPDLGIYGSTWDGNPMCGDLTFIAPTLWLCSVCWFQYIGDDNGYGLLKIGPDYCGTLARFLDIHHNTLYEYN